MQLELEDLTGARVLELDTPPVIYIDDVLSVHVRGPIVHVVSFAFRKWAGELVKVPVVEIIRPTHVDVPGRIRILMALAMSGGRTH